MAAGLHIREYKREEGSILFPRPEKIGLILCLEGVQGLANDPLIASRVATREYIVRERKWTSSCVDLEPRSLSLRLAAKLCVLVLKTTYISGLALPIILQTTVSPSTGRTIYAIAFNHYTLNSSKGFPLIHKPVP